MKRGFLFKKYIIRPFVWLNYIVFGFINRNMSKSNMLYKCFQLVFNQWMCLRFRCEDCSFKYPINLRLNEKYFKIGKKCGFGKNAVLTAWDQYGGDRFNPKVCIGQNCNFGDYLHLTCINSIIIGDGVLTGRWVTITDNNHGRTDYDNLNLQPAKRKLYTKGPVIIGNNVWIGDKATILPGVTIGEGAVIAANSVVTQSIPPKTIAVGNPIKIIQKK